MKWSDEHDLMPCRKVLLLEPFKHPRQSKERGEIWGEIALSLIASVHRNSKLVSAL